LPHAHTHIPPPPTKKRSRGIKVETLSKQEGDKKKLPYVIDYIKGNKLDVVINVPEGTKRDEEVTIG
jgi:hypothetical protein